MSESRAPEWDQGMGLTWSGRWHVKGPDEANRRYDVSLCGAYLYRPGDRDIARKVSLIRIARGEKSAPVCSKCVPPGSDLRRIHDVDQANALTHVICKSAPVTFCWEEALVVAKDIIGAGWVKR